jgi:hypothetical protein
VPKDFQEQRRSRSGLAAQGLAGHLGESGYFKGHIRREQGHLKEHDVGEERALDGSIGKAGA